MRLFSLFILLFISINSSGQTTKSDSIPPKNIEDKIDKLIFAIPEVKEKAASIEKETKEQRHLKVWIYEAPKENHKKYYWVKVGEDNGTNFVTHFNFYVYENTFEIKYYDTANDSVLSLDKWRELNAKEK